MGEIIKAYKGFNKDMTCRDFQYEEGKEYEEERAETCSCGFHACEHPLDCLGYYDPAHSVYHEVEQSGEISKRSDDTKVASTKIKIGARVSIAGLVQAAIEYTKERVKPEAETNEDYGASSATGDYGASSATGDYGASSATGNCGASSATGDYGASSATGDYGASSATGYKGASSATGYKGASSATGDYGASSATGNCGASSATGYKGKSAAENQNSVAVAWGPEAMAKGVKESTLVLAEWERIDNDAWYWKEETWEFVGSLMVRVDGKKVKENTWYTLKNGELMEVKDE
ncbi:DUF7666 domain-containing protein [Dorea longicatena]|uniref:DUF7666 domain-containing protein n=1 Tax=Dorea longicatena TaxID=88431 RepID=UPI0034A24560